MTATKTIDLLKLAERCEQASTDYQATMLKEAAYAILGDEADNRDNPDFWPKAIDFTAKLRAQAYLDAAMTLVPGPDWEWSLEICEGSLFYSALDRQMVSTVEMGDPMRGWRAEAATPALALCAAALRAMEASNGKGDNP